MKSDKRIHIFIYVFLLFCFVSSFYSSSSGWRSSALSDSRSIYHDTFFEFVAPSIQSPEGKVENLNIGANQLPTSSLKRNITEYAGYSSQAYRQLFRKTTNLLFKDPIQKIKFQDTDIIFPFHTFW